MVRLARCGGISLKGVKFNFIFEHSVRKSNIHETFIKSCFFLFNSSEETSEVDGKDTFSRNAARRVHIKNNTKKHVDDPEREARTIFVGNVPYAHAKKKKIIKFFSQFGEVESARFRCAPLKDPRMSKKVEC